MGDLRLDASFLDDAGLGSLEPAKKERLLVYIEATLRERVGLRFASEATPEQLEQLEGKSNDDKLAWIERTFPNSAAIIQDELALLQTEVADMAEDVLAAGADEAGQN